MIQDIRTCRFCKKSDFTYNRVTELPNLFKFGERHYAHAQCLIEHRGAATFDYLPAHMLRQFPAPLAARHQMLDKLLAALHRAEAAEVAV